MLYWFLTLQRAASVSLQITASTLEHANTHAEHGSRPGKRCVSRDFHFLLSSCCCCFLRLLIFKRPVQFNPLGQRQSPLHPHSEGTWGLGDLGWPDLFCRGFCPLRRDPQLGSGDCLPLWISWPQATPSAQGSLTPPGWLQPPVPRRVPEPNPATVTAGVASKLLFARIPTCLVRIQAQPLPAGWPWQGTQLSEPGQLMGDAVAACQGLWSVLAQPSLGGSHAGFWP